MPDEDDHERRITSLEEQAQLESGLRAAIDRDLSDLKQRVDKNTDLLQALGETQSDHGRFLRRLDDGMGVVRRDLEGLRGDVTVLRADVSACRTDVGALRAELHAEARGLKAEIGGLRTEMASEISGIKTEISGLRTETASEIGGLRTEMVSGISGLRTEMASDVGGLRTEMNAKFDQVLALVGQLVEQRGPAA
jgi:chromosome segregation ATPase